FKGQTSLVFLQEDEEYECDHCEALIYVEDGETRHEEIEEVACAKQPESVVIVPLEEDVSLNCPFCKAGIKIIEGKVFHPRRRGKLRIFLCHASEDKVPVRKLFRKLLTWGHDPWLDEERIPGGQDWDEEIRKAIQET